MAKFVHLHTHSHYSLLDGLTKIEELVERVKETGMDAVALTDHGSMYGAVEFYKKAKKGGIKPIMGVEAYVAPNGHLQKRPGIDNERFHLTLLAKNHTGWQNMLKLVTTSQLDGFYYKPRIDAELLHQHHEGIICLSGCPAGQLSRLLESKKRTEAEKLIAEYKEIFGEDYYLEIQPHNKKIWPVMKELSEKFNLPLVATQDSHYARVEDKNVHEILLAVQTGGKLDDTDRMSMKDYDLSLRSPEEMETIFAELPEAVTNTVAIAEKCAVDLELGKNKLPKYILPEGETSSFEYLKKLVQEKLPHRYSDVNEVVLKRIEMELGVIEKTGFSDYFLIVQDFINWAKNHGIVVGPGRGSAAGSALSYVLGITNLDPIAYDLLFERFLNPDRIQVPDVDVDIADTRRDEVVAYVRQKYGNDKVAQIITFGTMAARAAIRDTGRALGLSYEFCDQISKLIPFNPTQGMKVGWLKDCLVNVAELKHMYEGNPQAKKLIDLAMKMEGVARHASVHACGVVISPEPLVNFMPLQKAPQGDDSVITQFEMHAVEDLGILKMDFLGLKNLTIIEQALRLIREHHGVDVEMDKIPLNDDHTFEILKQGDTTGVFQLESSGMRRYLKELKPSNLEDIIVMVALYRPGPMELIPNYINRKFGREAVTYLHPKLEPILKNTYGIGVYQEQMMRIARDLSGFTLAEADTLRKAIGKKIKELLAEQQVKIISGMIKNGISEKTAQEIWELFPPFARYGFNRSHAACYGMIAYQTAYLKAHYPVEFMTALLNVSGTDIERINFLVTETKKMGIPVLPPDVNGSDENFSAQEKSIRFGLLAIKNLGAGIVEAIIKERGSNGSFVDLKDLATRIKHRDLNKKSLEALIKSGALDSIGLDRAQAVANLEDIVTFVQNVKKAEQANQSSLFGGTAIFTGLRLKPTDQISKIQLLSWEKELLGLYVSDHPIKNLTETIKKTGAKVRPIREALALPKRGKNGPRVVICAVVSNIHKILTKKGDPMLFVGVEDGDTATEMMVFGEVMQKHPTAWEENKVLLAAGRFSFRGEDEPKFICDDVRVMQA